MGALRGSLTFSRFYVTGDVPDDVPGATLKRIRANAFQPLSPDDDKTEGYGWASIEDPFDTDLDHEKVFYNEYVCLGLRLDRWVVPGPLLKANLREAEQELFQKRGLERLGRKPRPTSRVVVRKLRRRLVPSLKTYDVVWNLSSNVVHLYSQSERIGTLLDDLFKRTFKLDLVPEAPARRLSGLRLDAKETRVFSALEETLLARAERAETEEAR